MDLKIEAKNLDLRKGWQERIEEEKDKLIRHYAGFLLHLRVCIESTSAQKEGGFEVRLVASVPQDTVVVTRHGEKVRPALIEAFDVLRLQLKEIQRKKHKNHKTADTGFNGNEHGVINALFPLESYGFITTMAGQEIYFHENALKDIEMSKLNEGDAVSFGIGEGDKGPKATWVRAEKN